MLISAFSKKGEEVNISLEELTSKINIERDQVEAGLRFWVNSGVLNELPNQVF
jgi:hypothetical protein